MWRGYRRTWSLRIFELVLAAAIVGALAYFIDRNAGGDLRGTAGEVIPVNDRILARVFGQPVHAPDFGKSWQGDLFSAVRQLRGIVLPEALRRFVLANGLQSTDADFAAYAAYQKAFRGIVAQGHAGRIGEIDARLASRGLSAEERARLEREQASRNNIIKFAAERDAMPATDPKWRSASASVIEEHKAYKALFEKYGGSVYAGDSGPYPSGAIARLLREQEGAGDFEILDPKLRDAFWKHMERLPQNAAKRGQIDFTYFWLQPVENRTPGLKKALGVKQ